MCILLSHLCIFLPIYLQVIISNINSSKIGSLHSSSVRLFLYFPFSLTDRGDNSLTSISHKVVILCKLLPYTVLISFLYSLANILIVLGKMTLYSTICITQWHLNSKLHKFFWGALYIYLYSISILETVPNCFVQTTIFYYGNFCSYEPHQPTT